MSEIKDIKPCRVWHYFEEISAIPRGSGNMRKIADYCENFAKMHNFEYIRDESDNIIIFKNGSAGYEESEPVILQGHLDMVCQKTEESSHNFEKDGIKIYKDGDFVKADGTTLGADNGIAVAMALAILESKEYLHPPIEAVFTIDEEIGMLGAMALDMSVFKARRMINVDSEEEGVVTVSCAGGSDFKASLPVSFERTRGKRLTLSIRGLKGGHSGIEINSGRVNADVLMGRVLNAIAEKCGFDIISINGGDKSNAIANRCTAEICTDNTELFFEKAQKISEEIKQEISHREPCFGLEITKQDEGVFEVLKQSDKDKLLAALVIVPNGVLEMSTEISGLVETSLNLGIMRTEKERIVLGHSLRSNKRTAHLFLAERLKKLFGILGFEVEESGYYPPWEYKENSSLEKLFCNVYAEQTGKTPEIAAIHAGLECGVFASAIDGLECISVGPEMSGVHTVEEKLSISSTERLFNALTDTLKQMK